MKKRVRLIVMLSSCTIFFLCIATLHLYQRYVEREIELAALNDSADYLVDLTRYLGNEWTYFPFPDIDRDNAIGFDSRIAGSSESGTGNVNNDLAFVRHRVMAYVNDQAALEAYFEQKTMFNNQSHPTSPWNYLHFTGLNADTYTFACSTIKIAGQVRDIECKGLFLYRRHLSYIFMFPSRDYKSYIEVEDIPDLILEIEHSAFNR